MKANPVTVYLLSVFLITLCFSCGENEQPVKKTNRKDAGESLLKANKKLAKSEDQQIEDFIARYGWKMNKTGTGLRYLIYKEGDGIIAKKGNLVSLSYSLSLLTGEVCYGSKEKGNKIFKVGQGGVEPGLEEGILFLKKGDRAKIILPSHLAFGLVGDGDKIPAKATLVYDIEVLEVK